MTATILFHPQLKAIDAARIAREQGGRLVWRSARQRIKQAMQHTDQAAVAAEAEDYYNALQHLRAARAEIERNVPEVMPCAG